LHRASNQVVALDRARWLAELEVAIAQAQKLAWQLGVAEGDCEEARSLYARLEVLHGEVQSLRFEGFGEMRREIDLAWLERHSTDDRG